MARYKVLVKEVYVYDNIEAGSKEEAIQNVLETDWMNHDEQDHPLETEAEREED